MVIAQGTIASYDNRWLCKKKVSKAIHEPKNVVDVCI